jgi:predicted dehydrogenase
MSDDIIRNFRTRGTFSEYHNVPRGVIIRLTDCVFEPAIRDAGDVKLLAVYSRSKKSASELNAGANVDIYSDDAGTGKEYDDLLAREDIKAVVIAYASSFHMQT